MKTETNLLFIRDKIYQIRSALMYSMSNELVKMPNNIVTILRIDEEGQLWFRCKRPHCSIDQVEQSFPARLVFYRKGIPFFLEVSGKAYIVADDNSSLRSPIGESKVEKPVLIRMKMNNMEYTKPTEKRKKNRFGQVLENSYKWILHTIAISREEKSVLHKLHQLNHVN